jgi:hypothetical protein
VCLFFPDTEQAAATTIKLGLFSFPTTMSYYGYQTQHLNDDGPQRAADGKDLLYSNPFESPATTTAEELVRCAFANARLYVLLVTDVPITLSEACFCVRKYIRNLIKYVRKTYPNLVKTNEFRRVVHSYHVKQPRVTWKRYFSDLVGASIGCNPRWTDRRCLNNWKPFIDVDDILRLPY